MTFITAGTENDDPIQLHVQDVGTGSPVVLIHGWPLSARSWEPQVKPLVDAGHRVISYDRRGFGQSTQPFTGYDYDTMAADLQAILVEKDLTDVTLVGFSMGGGEVARYLGAYGSERVAKAVFASAVPPYLYRSDENPDGGLDDETIAGFESAVTGDRLAFLEEFATNFYSADGELLVSEALRRHTIDMAAFASPKGTLDCIAAWARTDFRDDLATIDVPTLILHGSADAIVPIEVSGQRTASAVADAKLHVIEGGPHGINASHTGEFNTALIDFLAG
jgi:non-heme chloroperoxidase